MRLPSVGDRVRLLSGVRTRHYSVAQFTEGTVVKVDVRDEEHWRVAYVQWDAHIVGLESSDNTVCFSLTSAADWRSIDQLPLWDIHCAIIPAKQVGPKLYESQREAIVAATRGLENAVRHLLGVYAAVAETEGFELTLEDIQPEKASDCYAMSLDEWVHELVGVREEWAKMPALKDPEGEGGFSLVKEAMFRAHCRWDSVPEPEVESRLARWKEITRK